MFGIRQEVFPQTPIHSHSEKMFLFFFRIQAKQELVSRGTNHQHWRYPSSYNVHLPATQRRSKSFHGGLGAYGQWPSWPCAPPVRLPDRWCDIYAGSEHGGGQVPTGTARLTQRLHASGTQMKFLITHCIVYNNILYCMEMLKYHSTLLFTILRVLII